MNLLLLVVGLVGFAVAGVVVVIRILGPIYDGEEEGEV